jgi:hypothetical protein
MAAVATGYAGAFRGVVVDDADPMEARRLLVSVPEVHGGGSAWAAPGSTGSTPAVGDLVWVSFENGDSDYPIWHLDEGAAGATAGYTGWYRARVVDNQDPELRNRVSVSVEAVDSTPTWANPSPDAAHLEPPPVGADVWVQYEGGDPQYPLWVGIA